MPFNKSHLFTPTGMIRLRVIFAALILLALIIVAWPSGTPKAPDADGTNIIDTITDAVDGIVEEIPLGPLEDPMNPDMTLTRDYWAVSKPMSRHIRVSSGDSLGTIIESMNVVNRVRTGFLASLSDVFDARDIRVGQKIYVELEPLEDGLRSLKKLELTLSQINKVSATKILDAEPRSTYRTVKKEQPTLLVEAVGEAIINEQNPSLSIALDKAGVPPVVVGNLIRYYSWDIDFQRDIHPGNTINILFEKTVMADTGELVRGKGKILYAEITTGGKSLPLYYFKKKDGTEKYYNDKGQSPKKALLTTPVDGARISSGYGYRRHPVLGYNKLHKGVDFAAPTGTPVFAAGDGVVEKAEWFSSYGKYIRLRHSNGYKTAYAHLNGFAKGISRGKRVKQGQIIGYIGTTGRSTGPHLHYEVLLNNKQINPKNFKKSVGEKLTGSDLTRFKELVGNINARYDTLKNMDKRTEEAPEIDDTNL